MFEIFKKKNWEAIKKSVAAVLQISYGICYKMLLKITEYPNVITHSRLLLMMLLGSVLLFESLFYLLALK